MLNLSNLKTAAKNVASSRSVYRENAKSFVNEQIPDFRNGLEYVRDGVVSYVSELPYMLEDLKESPQVKDMIHRAKQDLSPVCNTAKETKVDDCKFSTKKFDDETLNGLWKSRQKVVKVVDEYVNLVGNLSSSKNDRTEDESEEREEAKESFRVSIHGDPRFYRTWSEGLSFGLLSEETMKSFLSEKLFRRTFVSVDEEDADRLSDELLYCDFVSLNDLYKGFEASLQWYNSDNRYDNAKFFFVKDGLPEDSDFNRVMSALNVLRAHGKYVIFVS